MKSKESHPVNPATAVPIGQICAAPSGDPEHASRIEAQRVTLEFASRSRRRVDCGRQPISDSPLFGGSAQGSLFDEEKS